MTVAAGLWAFGVVPAVRASAAQDAVPEPLVDEAFFDEVRERLAEAFRSTISTPTESPAPRSTPTPSVGSAPAMSSSTRYIRRRCAA